MEAKDVISICGPRSVRADDLPRGAGKLGLLIKSGGCVDLSANACKIVDEQKLSSQLSDQTTKTS